MFIGKVFVPIMRHNHCYHACGGEVILGIITGVIFIIFVYLITHD